MAFSYPKASVVIASYNNRRVLRRVLDAMLRLEYPNEYEVIVVDDGSSDGTIEMLEKAFGKEKKVRVIGFGKNKGVCKARNEGIRAARFPVFVNMDHDCIPSKSWLKDLVKGFDSPKVGVVSSFGSFGGTSTAFRAGILKKLGGYDEKYFYYREDTDLTFSVMDLGYEYKVVKADYEHDHKEVAPRGFAGWVKYVLKRLGYHQNDVLLFKKHPKLAGEFLDVKLGFLVNPKNDFCVAANLWKGSSRKMKLCSPRGLVLIENRSPLHALAIVLLAFVYMVLVKFSRLWGSLRFGKLLV
jgi:glycosyltransferase involved in cell wall biosynthesis